MFEHFSKPIGDGVCSMNPYLAPCVKCKKLSHDDESKYVIMDPRNPFTWHRFCKDCYKTVPEDIQKFNDYRDENNSPLGVIPAYIKDRKKKEGLE